MVRRRFLRRLPRPVRWLWFAILAVLAAELAALGLGLALGDAWLGPALQLSSLLVGPLAVGLLIVLVAARWTARDSRPPAEAGPPRSEQPPAPRPGPGVPVEVQVGRRAGEAVSALARSREGKAAIRQAARLARAVRAAAQPEPGERGGG
jgi:hypothetical protein